MGISKRQYKFDEKGKRLLVEYKLSVINGEIFITKLKKGLTVLETVAKLNKQRKKLNAIFTGT